MSRALDYFKTSPTFSNEGEEDYDLDTVTKERIKRPSRYKVLIHNDDYTTMEFVIFILQTIFGKTYDEAKVVMLKVHHEGVGVCGIYTHEIAESKSSKVTSLAKEKGHPLKCTIEEE